MENEEFVEWLGRISHGLPNLAAQLYKASKPGVSNAVRSDVMARARNQIKAYEDFLPILSEGRREVAVERCEGDLADIRRFLTELERME